MKNKNGRIKDINSIYQKVKCFECNNEFYRITNTHLQTHNITHNDYLKKYPEALFEDPNRTKHRQEHKRNKNYNEIYGEEKAELLKKQKSLALTKYKLISVMCPVCKRDFFKKENTTQKYCSKKCAFDNINSIKIKVKCLECKKEFITYPIENKNSRFCSHKCYDIYNQRLHDIEVICVMCGKQINEKLYKIKTGNIFCSKDCRNNYNIGNIVNYKLKAFAQYGKICVRCNSNKNILVHHKDGDRLNNNIENLEVLCRACHSKLHRELSELQRSFIGESNIENGVILILNGLHKAFGLDISNENFKGTPKRVARAYYEIFKGINADKELHNIAETSFPSEYDGMIIAKDIECFSMCPHHLLPVEYIVNVGYIPDKKTVGISKLSRIVELLAKQPELQEMFTKKISNLLQKELSPKGIIVQVKGRHLCMAMRGVKQRDSWTFTSSIEGVFKTDLATREEFALMLKN